MIIKGFLESIFENIKNEDVKKILVNNINTSLKYEHR